MRPKHSVSISACAGEPALPVDSRISILLLMIGRIFLMVMVVYCFVYDFNLSNDSLGI